ncbi:MAG: cation diffusion facilitator family transporter [Candidatus Latescibacteria bacterium]|nr:cation diffusion facilitator family transporter [Candidatus Latescibacterota bacterium]
MATERNGHGHGDSHDHDQGHGHHPHEGHGHDHTDGEHDDGHDHGHEGQDHGGHGHTHGVIDPTIASTERGIWAIKWSFIGLMATALFQVVIVVLSGSVALLADTIHNFGDASTAIPLWIAFLFARLRPSKRFSFGYGRVEDLAGVLVVLTILFSAVVAGYESVNRLLHPQPVTHLVALVVASIVGFIGNEAVAVFRIRVGREIGSVALIADGYHARVDGWTSLAVLFGAAGVWLGYPLADPIVGILITLAIAGIVWKSGVAVFTRALDGVEPEYIDEIEHTTMHVSGVVEVTDVRARWIGHRLHAEVNVAVDSELSVVEAHEISEDVHHRLLHQLPYLARATIHIDPVERAGEVHHRIPEHAHDNLEAHSH